MKLKVMTYNVLYGFHDRQERTMVAHPERAAAACEVVRAEQPDILALTEAVYGAHFDVLLRPDYQSLFGLPHLAQASFHGDWGNCLLSRFPIKHTERRSLGKNRRQVKLCALRALLDVEGKRLLIDVAHPSPYVPESERVAGFAPLLVARPDPSLLVGDFNALSDEDPYDAATLVEQMRPYETNPEPIAEKMLDRQLIASLRAAGLRDTLPPENRTHTIPTTLDRPGATQGARLRIDYIFASPSVRVLDAAVIKTPATELASDHYPVVATIEI